MFCTEIASIDISKETVFTSVIMSGMFDRYIERNSCTSDIMSGMFDDDLKFSLYFHVTKVTNGTIGESGKPDHVRRITRYLRVKYRSTDRCYTSIILSQPSRPPRLCDEESADTCVGDLFHAIQRDLEVSTPRVARIMIRGHQQRLVSRMKYA